MYMKRPNWPRLWHGFVRSNYITALWNWFMMLAGKASEPVLFASVLYSGYQLVPGVPQPTPGLNAIAFVTQQAALDIGGMGLIKLTKDEDPGKFKFARWIGYALIGLMVVNMIVATAGKVFAIPFPVMQFIEGILLIIRSVMAVLFGHAIHTLKDESIDVLDLDIDAIVSQAIESETEQLRAAFTWQIEDLKQRLEEVETPVLPTQETLVLDMPDSVDDDDDSDATITAESPVQPVSKSPSNNAVSSRRSVTVKEASLMLDLSESYVRDLRKKGTLKRSSGNANLIVMSSILKYQETRQKSTNSGPLPADRPEPIVQNADVIPVAQSEPDERWETIKLELANGHSRDPFPLSDLVRLEV
jgi:hypothetical protein